MRARVEATRPSDYASCTMTKALSLAALAAGLLVATSAFAQMYPGEGVSVNPEAVYTAGPLGPYRGVIRLRPPVAHRATHRARRKSAAEAENASAPHVVPQHAMPDLSQSAAAETANAIPKPKKIKAAETAPAMPPADSGANGAGGLPLALAPDEPQPAAPLPKKAKLQKQASIAPPPAAETANFVPATQAPGTTGGLSKRGEILFARNATDPGTATINKLHSVANELSSLLSAGAGRVQLDAYGGSPGDKSSDARRISLKRALVIRQILIEDGIPSERIDVRAMGGIDDHGAPDRVDVYISAG